MVAGLLQRPHVDFPVNGQTGPELKDLGAGLGLQAELTVYVACLRDALATSGSTASAEPRLERFLGHSVTA